MDIPTAQPHDLPLGRGLSSPSNGVVAPLDARPLPEIASASDADLDYPTPPPRRVFFVTVHYRRLGPGAPLPLPPGNLDGGA
jgi:hypothetical protein